jgi:hypothetical protein
MWEQVKSHPLLVAAFLLLLVSVGLVLWNPTFSNELFRIFDGLIGAAGWTAFIIDYSYRRSDTFYLRANSVVFWITNRPTKWNLTIDYRGVSVDMPLDALRSAIETGASPTSTVWHDGQYSKIINFPGYTIRLKTTPYPDGVLDLDNLESTESVSMQISDLELPYRSFRSKLEEEIIPLVDRATAALKPREQQYAVKIRFQSKNPYFGFFVRRLALPQIVSFSADVLDLSAGGEAQNVCVRKDQIEIVTDSLLALQALSKKYVALSLNP